MLKYIYIHVNVTRFSSKIPGTSDIGTFNPDPRTSPFRQVVALGERTVVVVVYLFAETYQFSDTARWM